MTNKYSHRERLEMILAGQRPDRAAASIWRHFYHREATGEMLVEAMLAYQQEYDWDFMKINPRASYHVEDWGNTLEWSTDELLNHRKLEFAVKTYDDWNKIDSLPPTSPVLGDHLRAIGAIRRRVGAELPLFMTVFSPLSVARYLVGDNEKLLHHLKAVPDRLLGALDRITETFERYAAEIRNAGADGLFFATTHWASATMLSRDEYEKFGRPFDLRVIRAAGGDALNLLHVCAGRNYLMELIDYPARLVNWDMHDPTNIPLDKGFDLAGDKVVVGGLDNNGWLRHSRPDEIRHEIARIKETTSGNKFIFGPGCTIRPDIPPENIRAVRDSL